MNYLATIGPAIAAWAGVIVIILAWVVAADWCAVYIIRAWRHRKIAARMDSVLGRR